MSGRGSYEPGQKTIWGIVSPAIGAYLAVIIDLHSRQVIALRVLHAKPFRVIGWAIRNRMKQDLALRALSMAIAIRRPPPGCIHHTDRERATEYINGFYNPRRKQPTLGWKSPVTFERKAA